MRAVLHYAYWLIVWLLIDGRIASPTSLRTPFVAEFVVVSLRNLLRKIPEQGW